MRHQISLTVLGLVLFSTGFSAPLSGVPTDESQSLKATTELVSEKYCRNDDKMYTVIKKLRVNFLNQSKKNLIVDKRIGFAWYGMVVARDLKNLAAGKYEYHPIIEWGTSPPPGELLDESPMPPFAILAPSESFQVEADFWVEVRLHDSESIRGDWPVRPGDHVLQLQIGSWWFLTKPEEVQKRWEKIGDLIYKTIDTEPLAFNLPLEPKLEDCKQ